jgi:hypothetical protein
MPDISNILSSTQIALEREAAGQFGTAVEDFARGLGLGGLISGPGQRIARRDPTSWVSSSYAAALAGATNYRPKLKFLFKVQFIFKAGVIQSLLEGGLITSAMADSVNRNEFTFMIKTVDRPKVDFEYEEDVNMYNFRTKVLKKIRHRELTIAFMDDTGNRVFDFFRILMMLYSPITRRQMSREGTTTAPDSNTAMPGNGMSFGNPSTDYGNIAHRGVINTNVGQALDCIRVKQMFMQPSAIDGGFGPPNEASTHLNPSQVIFDFLNPRLVSFDLDDLSHETSDPNLLTMQFDYDWMEMVKIDKLVAADAPNYNISVPGVTGAPVDVLSGREPLGVYAGVTLPVTAGSQTNPFLAIIGRQLGRAAQQVTLDTVNRSVSNTFGNGRFATDMGGRLSGVLGGAVSGIVGSASRSLFGGGGSSPAATSARAVQPVVSDSATAGGDTASITSSSDAYVGINPVAGP